MSYATYTKLTSVDEITFDKVVKLYGNEPFYIEQVYKYGDGWVKIKEVCFKYKILEYAQKGYVGFKFHVADQNNELKKPDYNISELIK